MLMIIQTYGTMLLKAMGHTLLLCLLSLVFASVIGMIFGLMNVGHNRALNFIGTVYVDAVRGVPLIVLAYFIYFGIPTAIQQGLGIMSFRLSPLQAWAIVGIMYLIVITILSKVSKQIERRVNRGR